MSLEKQLISTLRTLSPEKQRSVLDFAEYLANKHLPPLDETLEEIRRRAESLDPDEFDSLVEEARIEFFQQN